MVEIADVSGPIGQLLQGLIGTEIILLGLLVLLLFIIFIVFKGGDLITFSVVLIPLVLVLAADNVGLLPQWLLLPIFIVLVFAVYMFFRNQFPN